MADNDIMQRIIDLEREIAVLPSGSVSKKTIKDKVYYYHRMTRDGKVKETYVSFDDVDELKAQIKKRRALEKELKELKRLEPAPKKKSIFHDFNTYIRIGEQLKKYASPVKNYKKRECYSKLYEYIYGGHQDKVFVLYGLRRTGKTTLIRQIIADMTESDRQKSAFIQVKMQDDLAMLNKDLKYLERQGYKYVFIDEVTLMEDFIEGAALFSDIYAACGMKIVLSGTDSLGFLFTESEELYDRCITLHTTFIPYRDFEKVLGIKGIDEYIRFGGTMSLSGINYNEDSPFADTKKTNEYIDTAIARNIQHSLRYYRDGSHFRHLFKLYEEGELTSAINRVVEDINHRFTVDVLTKTFKSSDLSISARNLLKDKSNSLDILSNIDRESVEKRLMQTLDILNIEEQTIDIDETCVLEIKEYLRLLDVTMEIDEEYLPVGNATKKITITQPGMRYSQATELVNLILRDEKFNTFSAAERAYIPERILSEVKGRMLEEIILLETKTANPQKQVFKLQFTTGEFDMVIADNETLSCEIYEIKYSKEIVDKQYQHLSDEKKCEDTAFRFGRITGKYVIYRGETTDVNGIKYVNAEEYLKSLA
ncbi:MAG: AAA family ATPase [Clostridia bacterium]|nr:AAA family ATPase [Clostridia bacterium]